MEDRTADNLVIVSGFKAAGMASGIKKDGKKDLALIVSEEPAVAAGVFTKNRVVSSTVTLTREHIKRSKTVRAIVANSGNANACTGPQGMKDSKAVTKMTADALGIKPQEVLIASTGVIGVPLPLTKIEHTIVPLTRHLSPNGWDNAADAILTTDLVEKTDCVDYDDIAVGGICKGSGMIHPNMATMLSFICTNLAIEKKALQKALDIAVKETFNRINVDGDTSTNDMVLVLANGTARNTPAKLGSKAYKKFVDALVHLCRNQAFQIVKDGEGATKFVTVRVKGAKTEDHALKVSKVVGNSKLVQTALFGEDPNWGRIIAAVGYAGVPVNPDKIEIALNGQSLVKNGAPVKGLSTKRLEQKMKKDKILIEIDLHQGRASAETYTCDLSHDYIRINAEYTT